MVDWVLKLLGLAIGFYVFRGMLGRAKEGDLTRLLCLVGASLLLAVLRH